MTNLIFTRRHVAVLGLGAAVVGSWGCAITYGWGAEGESVGSDDIVACGLPDDTMAKTMGKANTVAFLGTTNTYLLLEGGEALLAMNKLDPKRLTTWSIHHLYLEDKVIWGNLEFTYTADTPTILEEEGAKLRALQFSRKTPQTMTRTVSIKGAVYPAIPLQGSVFPTKKNPQKFYFHAPSTKARKPDLGNLARHPLNLKLDEASAPLQLLGVTAFALSATR